MRVPEAIEALDTIRRLSPGVDVWRREVNRILDDVWLTAYEEGKDGVFEPPPGTGAEAYFAEKAANNPKYREYLAAAREDQAHHHPGKHARHEQSLPGQ